MNPPKSRWKKNNYRVILRCWLVFFLPVFSLFYLRLPHVSHCFNLAICFLSFETADPIHVLVPFGKFWGDSMAEVLWFAWSFADVPGDGQDFDGRKVAEAWRNFYLPVRFITRGHLLMAVPKPVEKGPPEEKNESCYVRPAPSIRLRWFGFSTDSWVTVPKMCVFTKAISDWAMLRLQKSPKLDAWDSTIALYELISGGLRTSKDEMTVMLPSAQATSIDRRWLGRWIHWLDSWSIGWSDGFPTDSDVVCYSIKAFEPNDIDTRII